MIFGFKDGLRQAVEAASGGLCTVMYTKKGQPVFLRRIPRFNLEDIDPALGTGPHPAFVVGGEVKSEIWVGMYHAHLSNGELLSVPGVPPSVNMTLAQAVSYARANGPGFHLMTNAEWAALALLIMKNAGGQDPLRGNTQYGRSHEAPWETGVRVDGGTPGSTTSDGRTLTGSGPLTWRHDGTPAGIADLVGNVWTWVAGLRLVNGEIQIIPDNNAALPTTDLSSTSTAWRAIRASDGALVNPGTPETLKYDIPTTASYSNDNTPQGLGTPVLRTTTQTPPAGWDSSTNQDYANGLFKNVTADTGISPPAILKALLLFPHFTPDKGRIHILPYGTRLPLRGGVNVDSTAGGLSALYMYANESSSSPRIGTRIAYVL